MHFFTSSCPDCRWKGYVSAMNIKIGTKLTAGFILVVLLMAAMALYSVSTSRRSLQESIGNSSMFLADEMLRKIDENIYLKINELQKYTKDSLLQKTVLESNKEFDRIDRIEEYINQRDREWISAPKEQITVFMRELISNELSNNLRQNFIEFYKKEYGFKVFELVAITNKYGAYIAQTGKTFDYRQDDEQWWQIARKKGFYAGDVEYDEITVAYGVRIAVRIDDKEGNFIGVMRTQVAARDIIKEIEIASKKHETTRINLITTDGRLIYATRVFNFLEDVSYRAFFKKIKEGSSFFIASEGGRERLFSYAHSKGYRKFEGLKWILVVKHDVDEVLKPIFILRNRMVAASLILIIIGILIASIISRSIINPINKLTKAVEDISAEKLDVEIDPRLIESKDETGELALSFIRMAEDLKDSQEKLIRSQRLAAIGQLASGVGHELRNPLGVIGNSVYYLNMKLKDADEKVSKHLNILKREIQRSNEIITDLLDFSRARPPSPKECNVNSIIKEALADIEVPKNIAVETQLAKNLTAILADPDQIRRVFLNISTNAVQAMPEGGRLQIHTAVKGDFLEIRFTDTGQGIPREKLKHIFEPLFTTRARGIGLGMSIVKSIVDGHKGRIKIESEVDKGTTFTVILPLIKGEV